MAVLVFLEFAGVGWRVGVLVQQNSKKTQQTRQADGDRQTDTHTRTGERAGRGVGRTHGRIGGWLAGWMDGGTHTRTHAHIDAWDNLNCILTLHMRTSVFFFQVDLC